MDWVMILLSANLAVQIAILFLLKSLMKRMDFSNEDAQVKATTERVKKAKERLPQ